MLTRFPLFCFVVLAGLGALCLSGCAKEPELDRRIVAGRVTYQGKAIAAGEIRFTPLGTGPVTAALIRNGEYEVTHQGGAILGTTKVEIIATSSSNPDASLEELENTPAPRPVVLPKKYNTESSLQVDIQQGSGKQTLDFDLSAKSAAVAPTALGPATFGPAVLLTSLC